MHPFEYVKPADNVAALAALQCPGARLVAGGTGLIDLMKLNVERPALLVDINALALDQVDLLPDGGLRIGAMMRNSDMALHALIRERYPMLSQALLAGASPQLRNMATLGGNLMQRTRCAYFRDISFACNKRLPESGCAAMEGYHRGHAVLGVSAHCIAAHPSDMAVALVALDAQVHLLGPRGTRDLALTDFYPLPGDTPHRETMLAADEMIVAISLRPPRGGQRSLYTKYRDRAAFEFALVSVAAAMHIENRRIQDPRLALGGVGTRPWRALEAEALLRGAVPGRDSYRAAADAALAMAQPRQHNRFKVSLARRAIVRSLETLEAMA